LPRPQVATCAAAVEALKVKLESMEKAPQQWWRCRWACFF
jgi:hypothetical protein